MSYLKAAGRRPEAKARRALEGKAATCLLAAFCLLPFAFALAVAGARGSAQASAYYVAPNGSDSNPGTLSEPWRTVVHAVSRLSPGDTLYLREGTYQEKQIVLGAAGLPSRPITIRNHPGEKPVLDGGFPEFRTAGNSDWELHDASKEIYRSAKSYPSANAVYGYFGPENGGFRLVTYSDYADLSSDNEDYAEEAVYLGPGVFWNSADRRIYVRLKPSVYGPVFGYNVPSDTDPRRTGMFLFPLSYLLRFSPSAAYIDIQGIDLRYQSMVLEYQSGAHDISVAGCAIAGGQYHIVVRDGAHDLRFDGITDIDGFPPWVSWSDVKQGSRPGRRMQGNAFDLGAAYNIEIANCTIRGGFDAIDAIQGTHDVHIHHNTFAGNKDDVLEIGSGAWGFEVNDNTMICGVACVSRTGSGRPPSGKVGTKYIHHNVMDSSALTLFGRRDPRNLLEAKYHGPGEDGMNSGRAFNSHTGGAITGADPWKIYHNTVKVSPDMDHGGTGAAYSVVYSDPSCPHEVFNNIFIQTGDQWVLRGARLADGSQVFDGNLYFRSGTSLSQPLFYQFLTDTGSRSFDSLAEWKASDDWALTKRHYPPGWENSGWEGDPELDGDYRPSAAGPAASGAVDFRGKGWPGARGETFRGALAPSVVAPASRPPRRRSAGQEVLRWTAPVPPQ